MIKVAKNAGFCFGVARAVDMVYRELDAGKKVCTLGEIIHNPQMVEELADRGVLVVDSPADVPKGYSMVIRSHGVGSDIYTQLVEHGVSYVDATCPFVAKIHSIVANTDKEKEIVHNSQTHGQHLLTFEEMMDVCPAEIPAAGAITVFIQRCVVQLIFCIHQVSAALPCKCMPMPGVP